MLYPSRLSEYLVGKDQARSKTHQPSKVFGVEDGLAEHRKAGRIEGDFGGVSAAAEEAAVEEAEEAEEPRQIDIPIPEELPEGNGEETAPWDEDAPEE